MIPVSCFKDKHVALFGLGGSGIATAQALMAGGAKISAFDDKSDPCERARAAGIPIADLHHLDWKRISSLILSPGVPLTHPAPHWSVALAHHHGCEIIGDIELFARERRQFMTSQGWNEQDCPVIAITGTNGKSTTTALIAHLLRSSNCDVEMGGNIGTPILALGEMKKGRIYVIECSSYQIDLAPSMHPTLGILTNITPDHIDRHGTFTHYCALKERLMTQSRQAILTLDDAPSRAIAERKKEKITVSAQKRLDEGWFFNKSHLFKVHHGKILPIVGLDHITALRGVHNGQNALLAMAACEAMGVDQSRLQTALQHFPGLPHRMEEVGRDGPLLFINDSKATNAQATAPALASFEHIYWIAGGVAKEGGIEALKPFFNKIRKAYLIGDAAQNFCQTIGDSLPVSLSMTLATALTQAVKDAKTDMTTKQKAEEAAILLSPACASFDQFTNYASRGDAFRLLVQNLLRSR